MAIELKMWIKPDLDFEYQVELFVQFESSNFSGQSSAWFSLSSLKLFVENLSKYPLDLNSLPMLIGGFWNATASEIVQEHVYISVNPDGNTGAINLTVRLAVPDDYSEKYKLKYSMSANISTDYGSISEISTDLYSLILGNTCEIIFHFKE